MSIVPLVPLPGWLALEDLREAKNRANPDLPSRCEWQRRTGLRIGEACGMVAMIAPVGERHGGKR